MEEIPHHQQVAGVVGAVEGAIGRGSLVVAGAAQTCLLLLEVGVGVGA